MAGKAAKVTTARNDTRKLPKKVYEKELTGCRAS